MKREEWLEHLKKLPKDLFEKHGLKMPYEWSKASYEMINGCKYYPKEHAIEIGSKMVSWVADDPSLCEVNPHDPLQFAEIEKRGMELQKNDFAAAVLFNEKGRMECHFYDKDRWPVPYMKGSENFCSFPFDGIDIYYDPVYDLENNKELKLLAECVFIARRYSEEIIVPYHNENPEEDWGTLD